MLAVGFEPNCLTPIFLGLSRTGRRIRCLSVISVVKLQQTYLAESWRNRNPGLSAPPAFKTGPASPAGQLSKLLFILWRALLESNQHCRFRRPKWYPFHQKPKFLYICIFTGFEPADSTTGTAMNPHICVAYAFICKYIRTSSKEYSLNFSGVTRNRTPRLLRVRTTTNTNRTWISRQTLHNCHIKPLGHHVFLCLVSIMTMMSTHCARKVV